MILDTLVLLMLLPWPLVVMMSPMLIAAPAAVDRRSNLLMVSAMALYPLFIALLYLWAGRPFFSIAAATCFQLTLAACGPLLFIYGLPRMLWNNLRGISNIGYVATKKAVYLDGRRLWGARPLSFCTPSLPFSPYAHDAQRVYFKTRYLSEAQAASFVDLGDGFAHDAQTVFFHGKKLFWQKDLAADVASFARVQRQKLPNEDKHRPSYSRDFCRDQSGVYLMMAWRRGEIVKLDVADPQSFVVLGDRFVKDRMHVYRLNEKWNQLEIVADQNPDTFTLPNQ